MFEESLSECAIFWDAQLLDWVKFRFSEKATKFELWILLSNVKTKWKIFSNFVGYSEYINFMSCNTSYSNPLIGSLNVRNLRRQLWMTRKPPRQMTGAAAKGWKNVNKNILRARIRSLPWTLPTTTWQFRVLPSLLRLLKYYKQWDQNIYEVYLNLCTALILRFFSSESLILRRLKGLVKYC